MATSAKSLTLDTVFNVLTQQSLGYSFGKPLRVDEKSLSVVLPILRETSLKRQYLTFPETDKVLVFDTGKIDEMEAHNTTDETVFIRSGTIFTGQTQTRALQRSAIVFAGKKHKLGVRCIYRSKGISGQTEVKYGGLTPLSFDSNVYDHGYKPKEQMDYWAAANKTTSFMCSLNGPTGDSEETIGLKRKARDQVRQWDGAKSGQPIWMVQSSDALYGGQPLGGSSDHTAFWEEPIIGGASGPQMSMGALGANMDDLASHLDNFAKDFDHILSKVKLVDKQAGLALITERGVETIEIFDHADSWKALHESAVKRLGSNIVGDDEENVFDYKPEVAVKKTMQVLSYPWKTNRIYEHKPDNGEPHVLITGLSYNDYVGEVVEVNENVVHLVVLKKAA